MAQTPFTRGAGRRSKPTSSRAVRSRNRRRRQSMRGNNSLSLLLTNRDQHLFRELEVAKLVDREMVQEICGFPSVNRANDRLLRLHRAGFLRRHFVGTEAGGRKSLFTLSPKSAAIVLPASQ